MKKTVKIYFWYVVSLNSFSSLCSTTSTECFYHSIDWVSC